jgi:DNA-binding MarR family transcriptional regulator
MDIDSIAQTLPNRALRLSRLVVRASGIDATPSEVSLLGVLAEGPRRITELASIESTAQPRVTLLVDQLERRGWVRRVRDRHDRRVVSVALTAAGRRAVVDGRRRVAATIAAGLEQMRPAQVRSLAAATEAIDVLLEALERAPSNREEQP